MKRCARRGGKGGSGSVLNIVLVEPEIPQNCGNIARTCAATGSQLHLIRPLGFDISEKAVRRAGLDYWNLVEVFDYENLEDFFRRRPEAERDLWLTTTKAPRSYQEARFTADSWLFFGKETPGCLWLSGSGTGTAASACPWSARPAAFALMPHLWNTHYC